MPRPGMNPSRFARLVLPWLLLAAFALSTACIPSCNIPLRRDEPREPAPPAAAPGARHP